MAPKTHGGALLEHGGQQGLVYTQYSHDHSSFQHIETPQWTILLLSCVAKKISHFQIMEHV
jgi:hypothetical protein